MVVSATRTKKMLAASDMSTQKLYLDPKDTMTYGRRFANFFYSNGCYNPSSKQERTEENKDRVPSVDKAWEYFEHFVLPRCLVPSSREEGSFKGYTRADVGEHQKHTMLYPIWSTPLKDMGDFGVGIGLYFTSLRFLAIVTFIAGCINIPIMLYFSSDSYVGDSTNRALEATGLLGSAICVNTAWEVCPTCSEDDWTSFPSTDDRFAWGTNDVGTRMGFIKKNGCNVNNLFGILSLASLMFIFCAIYYWIFTQNRRVEHFDSAENSSTDYSIEIRNPPQNEKSFKPDVWKQWLESTFDVEVIACTIALDNEVLIRALVKRRQLINQFREMLPEIQDFDIDELQHNIEKCKAVPMWKQVLFRAATPESIYQSIIQQDIKIDQLSSKNYNVSSIIATFQTQKDQQTVLDRLVLPVLRQKQLPEEYKYDGVILDVKEPAEPSAVRWDDLNTPTSTRMTLIFITTIISFALIIGGGSVITFARRIGPETSSLAITVINQFTPRVVSFLTNMESHPNQSSVSASMYLKVTAFRWTNTALVMTLITPFTDTLQNGDFLIKSVYTMFMFDLLLTPALQILDIGGNLGRHYLGPRKSDQRRMNLSFKAGQFDLDDKYTNTTRIFFFTLFYCSLFPAGFFFASAIFAIAYWLDKFSILRTCAQGPRIGSRVAEMSNLFFLLCLATYAVRSSYSFAQFPFDSACDTGNVLSEDYHGTWSVNQTESVEISGENLEYQFCNQNLFSKMSFPSSVILKDSDSWMNDAQDQYSSIFAWVMIIVVVIIFATIVLWTLSHAIYKLFFRDFKPSDAVLDRFEEVEEIVGYVPQVWVDGYAYPFLLCDVDSIDPELIGWTDPYSSFDSHNLIFDVPKIAIAKQNTRQLDADDNFASDDFEDDFVQVLDESQPHIFSLVRSWHKGGLLPKSAATTSKAISSSNADYGIKFEEEAEVIEVSTLNCACLA